MIGKKINTAASMISNVVRLDEESQTVRLALGSREDGSRNGNALKPAVAITPATAMALAINASPPRRAVKRSLADNAPMKTRAGANNIQGCAPKFESKRPPPRATVFNKGFDGPSCGRSLVIRKPS